MSDVITKKCDECGKLRLNDSNHWLEGATNGHSMALGPIGSLAERGIVATLIKVGTAYKPEIKHFCGQACAMKWAGLKIGELRT